MQNRKAFPRPTACLPFDGRSPAYPKAQRTKKRGAAKLFPTGRKAK